jgi:hypothetical protein
MKFIYTKHAEKRMFERDIKSLWVEDCIEIPDYNLTKGDIVESYKKVEFKILKVVWVRKDSFIKVISVMWR